MALTDDVFAERLRSALRDRGMTQSGLAALTGLSPSAVGNYMTGRRRPSEETVGIMAAALGVPAGWLMPVARSSGRDGCLDGAAVAVSAISLEAALRLMCKVDDAMGRGSAA